MEESSITTKILREIRDEGRATRDELRATRDELRATRDELRATRDELSGRIDETNTRLDTVIREQIRQGTAMLDMKQVQDKLVDAVVGLDRRQSAVEHTLGEVVSGLRSANARLDNVLRGPLGRYVRAHDERIEDLEHRVEALEQKLG